MNQLAVTSPANANNANSADLIAEGATTANELVTFAIDDDQYGVDIMAEREIKGWTEISHLPKRLDYVRGVFNLRGVLVPIIDLGCRSGQGLTEGT